MTVQELIDKLVEMPIGAPGLFIPGVTPAECIRAVYVRGITLHVSPRVENDVSGTFCMRGPNR